MKTAESYSFPVELHPIKTQQTSLKNPGVEIPGKLAVVRTDTMTPLGIVSDKYAFMEHKVVVDGFRKALKGQEVKESISLQRNGAQLFMKYTFPRVQGEVQKGDIVGMQLLARNSYDGSSKLQLSLGAVRLVCENGMVMNKSFMEFSQKHIGQDSTLEIEEVSDKIGALVHKFEEVMPLMTQMSRKKMADDEKMFDPKKLKLPSYLMKIAEEEYNRAGDKTVWGFYNGLTYAITHKMRKESPGHAEHYGNIAWSLATRELARN